MLIDKIDIPKDYPKRDGLEAIHMDRLGKIIILTGKNGSGKSRLLNKIIEVFPNQLSEDRISQVKQQFQDAKNQLELHEDEILKWKDPTYDPGTPIELRTQKIEKLSRKIERSTNEVKERKQELQRQVLTIKGSVEQKSVLPYMPKQLNLVDPQQLYDQDKERYAKDIHSLGISNLSHATLSKIQHLHTQFRNVTHQDAPFAEDKKTAIIDEYKSLNGLVKDLLGTEIGNDERGYATLFNFPIGQAQLSDGQKILLQFAVAINCQGGKLSDMILIIDEPENHLHPDAIIEILETLIKKISEGQIWIATHNISVIAHFSEQASIWYMDNGKISNAGKIQEQVLKTLLGGPERIAKQMEFLERPDKLALVRFTQQCLFPPTTVMTGADDPQINQIFKVIEQLYKREGKIKILDYGAGKGRLLASMVDDIERAPKLGTLIDYVALDREIRDKECCESQITKVYGSAQDRWFDSYNTLVEKHNKRSFHLVILCNVLHEISPNEWKNLFGPGGELTELLTENGYLLIVEDQRIPIGEHAHDFGFLVLDTAALKDLFQIDGDDKIQIDSQREGRLKAHLIPKTWVAQASPISIHKSINTHQKHAKDEIENIRKSRSNKKESLFPFWLVQYANATLFKENMGFI